MGHKVSDGLSIVVTAIAPHSAGDPVEYDGIFGFAASDVADGDDFAITIGQEEREVNLPSDAGGWAVGDPVYWNGTAFVKLSTGSRYIGRATTGLAAVTAGVAWIVVDSRAFGDPVAQA